MKLVDTHCHLDFDAYQHDLEAVLERAWSAEVERILIPGIDLESSQGVLDLVEAYPGVHAAVGIHPNRARSWQDNVARRIRKLAHHPKVIAIGEIGLDYYRQRAPHSLQRKVLKRQLDLAQELRLPVVLHVRNADKEDRSCIIDLLGILKAWRREIKETKDGSRCGVLHSFSGNVEEAQRTMDLGLYLGITGPVTFDNAQTMQRVVTSSPLARLFLLIETDGPFLTPHPHRGKRNEPAYVQYVAEKIAELQERPVDEVAEMTTENADRLFQWS